MPNARLRQIYIAMLQARMLARAVPARLRHDATVGVEACLVSPTIDLGSGDLVSDVLAGGVVEFLRGAKLAEVLGSGRISKRRGVVAGCGEALRIAETPGVDERIWVALGAAAVLKALAARAKIEARADESKPKQAGVVVLYALPSEMATSLWRKALTFAHVKELPVLFVVLPTQAKQTGRHKGKMEAVSKIAITCGVPWIAVDADDAVAIYRVAQESIGHARSGGGAALMECVPFLIEAPGNTRRRTTDVVTGMEDYMVQRSVATRAWMQREAKSFARLATKERAASK